MYTIYIKALIGHDQINQNLTFQIQEFHFEHPAGRQLTYSDFIEYFADYIVANFDLRAPMFNIRIGNNERTLREIIIEESMFWNSQLAIYPYSWHTVDDITYTLSNHVDDNREYQFEMDDAIDDDTPITDEAKLFFYLPEI
jgi:hypothetical protein